MAGKTLNLSQDPHAMRVIAQLQETGSRLAQAALPKLAQTARQTRQTMGNLAHAAAETLADRAPANAGMLVATSGPLRAAGRSVARLARRRPLLFLVGGLAIAGAAIAISRRAKGDKTEAQDADEGSITDKNAIGEGSYAGTRDYRTRTQRFLKDKAGAVAKRAAEAKQALESPERDDLLAAEEEGLRHARS